MQVTPEVYMGVQDDQVYIQQSEEQRNRVTAFIASDQIRRTNRIVMGKNTCIKFSGSFSSCFVFSPLPVILFLFLAKFLF